MNTWRGIAFNGNETWEEATLLALLLADLGVSIDGTSGQIEILS
jgi:hypothetical protein